MGEFSKDVRLLAVLEPMESDGFRLMDAARFLANSVCGLMKVVEPGVTSEQVCAKTAYCFI